MKNKRRKILKLPIYKIISNNVFMLKMIHRSSSHFFVTLMTTHLIGAFVVFVSETFLLRFALNSINEGRTFRQIATALILWLVLQIITNAAMAVCDKYYYNLKIIDVKKDVHNAVYEKAVAVELACYENPKYYDDFVKAIDECGTRVEKLIASLLNIIHTTVNFSTNFTLIVVIDPFLLIFVLIPLLAVPIQSMKNKIQFQKNMEMKAENRRKDYARRTFYLADYAKEMRLTAMPLLMLERFMESSKRVQEMIQHYGLRLAVLEYAVSECNMMISSLGATLYAVWQTFGTGRLGYGDCLVVVNSLDSVSYTLTYSTDVLMKFQDSALYIENLRNFFEYTPKLVSGNEYLPKNGDIVLDNVSFKYDDSDKNVLSNITLRFGEKEKVAIVGHNGAGKTTLVKLLLRLYDCEGQITYGGQDVKDFKLAEYRDMFSVVMQDFHIFAITVAENVLLRTRKPDDDEIIKAALQESGLNEKVAGFEKGINAIMTKEFTESGQLLSGGEQQKLAISHVYSKQNRFVILDEPSSALDPIAEYEMYNHMMNACKDCGMIFISHRLSSAVMADKIYFMENGQVVEHGTHEELMKTDGKYAEMFRKQAQNYREVTL